MDDQTGAHRQSENMGWNPPAAPDADSGYGTMIDALRDALDTIAAARPDAAMVSALEQDLREWSRRLAPFSVEEADQIFAHRSDLPGRGQTMAPQLFVDSSNAQEIQRHVTFGRYYLGGNGAVHGGAIPLLFDEILGRLANASGRPRSRTAYLHTDFRSITPVGKRLTVRGWFVSEQGRKRLLKAEIREGDTLCAEAEGLFVQLNPGQP